MAFGDSMEFTETPRLMYDSIFIIESEIRLLALHASSSEDAPIEYTLQKANLEEEPHYFARSYVWGDQSVMRNITVNGSMVSVPNLFLRYRINWCIKPF
jgi:hypothetical protein